MHLVQAVLLLAKRHRAVVLAVLAAVAWTSWSAAWYMQVWGWDLSRVLPVPILLAQGLAVPLLAGLILFAARARHLQTSQLLTGAAYAAWFLAIFLGVAPGCFTEDSRYTFHMVRNGWWEGWYSPLHPMLVTALMLVLPWEFHAPGLFLALAWAAVYGLAHDTLRRLRAPWVAHVLLAAIALLPAQVAGALIVIRDGYFAALFIVFLLLLVRVMLLPGAGGRRALLAIALLGAFLAAYRAEAGPAVLVGFAALAASRREDGSVRRRRWRLAALLLTPLLLTLLLVGRIPALFATDWVKGNTWGNRSEREYRLTLIENPLGYIVQQPGVRISPEQAQAIEPVFRLSDLAAHACRGNLCLFYGGKWNTASSMEQRQAAFSAALRVFAEHPVLFARSRLATLDTVGDRNSQTTCSRRGMAEAGYAPLDLPGFAIVGERAVAWMRQTETRDGLLGGRTIWWNVYAMGAVCLLVLALRRRAPAAAAASAVLLVRTAGVVLAAPAGFTTYYVPLFIGAPLLALLCWAESRWRTVHRCCVAA